MGLKRGKQVYCIVLLGLLKLWHFNIFFSTLKISSKHILNTNNWLVDWLRHNRRNIGNFYIRKNSFYHPHHLLRLHKDETDNRFRIFFIYTLALSSYYILYGQAYVTLFGNKC